MTVMEKWTYLKKWESGSLTNTSWKLLHIYMLHCLFCFPTSCKNRSGAKGKNTACVFCNLKVRTGELGKASAALHSQVGVIHKQQRISYLYFPGVVHDDQTEQDDRGETDKAFQS